MSGNALILQNKGGGHGEIGFHLAKLLNSKGIGVTILNDGGSPISKTPFNMYDQLSNTEVIWTDLSSADVPSLLSGKTFDYVFDNVSKNEAGAKTVADLAKQWGVKNYVYVSSGGMYKGGVEMPMEEGDPVKETGQLEVEKYADSIGLPWSSFRPQYIYGPFTNKRDYLDFFFHRVANDAPIPIPGQPSTCTTLTHVEDVASMLAAVIGNPNAPKQVFNCATDRYTTYEGVVKLAAKALGKDPAEAAKRIVVYDAKSLGFDVPKGAFPFRPTHFFVSPEKAKLKLGWKPAHKLEDDVVWYADTYKTSAKPFDDSLDKQILAAVGK